jgi:hypothetical protein
MKCRVCGVAITEAEAEGLDGRCPECETYSPERIAEFGLPLYEQADPFPIEEDPPSDCSGCENSVYVATSACLPCPVYKEKAIHRQNYYPKVEISEEPEPATTHYSFRSIVALIHFSLVNPRDWWQGASVRDYLNRRIIPVPGNPYAG